MKELYFVMRGLSRLASLYAVFWVIGWGAESLTGGAFRRAVNPYYADWVVPAYGVFGLFVSGLILAALILLYSIGGGLRTDDDPREAP